MLALTFGLVTLGDVEVHRGRADNPAFVVLDLCGGSDEVRPHTIEALDDHGLGDDDVSALLRERNRRPQLEHLDRTRFRLIVGLYEYEGATPQPLPGYFKSTRAHNTVVVDGADRPSPAEPRVVGGALAERGVVVDDEDDFLRFGIREFLRGPAYRFRLRR